MGEKKIKGISKIWPEPLIECHLLRWGPLREEQTWGRWYLNQEHLRSGIWINLMTEPWVAKENEEDETKESKRDGRQGGRVGC